MQDKRLAPVLTEDGEVDLVKLGEISHKRKLGLLLSDAERDAHDAALEIRSGGETSTAGVIVYYAERAFDEAWQQHIREYGGEIVTETTRWEAGRDRPVRTRRVQRFRGARVRNAPAARTSARRRGNGKRPKSQSTRSSARSGDSGDDGPSDEPPPRRLCAFCGGDIPAARSPKATYCCDRHADRDRQRRKRARDRARSKLPLAAQPADFWRMYEITDADRRLLWELAVCRCNGHHVELEPGECTKCGRWLPKHHPLRDGKKRYEAFLKRLASPPESPAERYAELMMRLAAERRSV